MLAALASPAASQCTFDLEESVDHFILFEKYPLEESHIKISKMFEDTNRIVYEIIVEDYEPSSPPSSQRGVYEYFPKDIVIKYSVDSNIYIYFDEIKTEYWSLESAYPYRPGARYNPDYDVLRRGIGEYKRFSLTDGEILRESVKKDSLSLVMGLFPVIGSMGALYEYGDAAAECYPYDWWAVYVHRYYGDLDTYVEHLNSKPNSKLLASVEGETERERNDRHGGNILYTNILGEPTKSVRFTIPIDTSDIEDCKDIRIWVHSMSESNKKLGLYFEDSQITSKKISSDKIDDLILNLKSGQYDVRADAAEALGDLGNPRAVDPLIEALKDEDWCTRMNAAISLGEIGDPRAIGPLTRLLRNDGNDWVRAYAALALGEIGDPKAVDPLIAALKDEDKRIRFSAAEALGDIGDPEAIDPLTGALKDETHWVQVAAASSLVKLGNTGYFDQVVQALEDEDQFVRSTAARGLGEIGDPRAVDPLIVDLKNEDEGRVRERVAEALGNIGDPRAVNPLITALNDEDSLVREHAAMALGKIGDSRAIEPLADLASSDEYERVREVATEALAAIEGDR